MNVIVELGIVEAQWNVEKKQSEENPSRVLLSSLRPRLVSLRFALLLDFTANVVPFFDRFIRNGEHIGRLIEFQWKIYSHTIELLLQKPILKHRLTKQINPSSSSSSR